MSTPESGLERLADWLDGRLSATEADEVADQVRVAGPETAATVAWLRTVTTVGRTEPVPPELHARLERDFAARTVPTGAGRAHPRAGLGARARAVVVFDSLLTTGLSGTRGHAGLQDRQLVLSVEGLEIALDVGPVRARRAPVRAQLLPLDDGAADGIEITVWDRDGARVSMTTDSAGEVDLGVLSTTEAVLEIDGVDGRWPVAQAVLELDAPADPGPG